MEELEKFNNVKEEQEEPINQAPRDIRGYVRFMLDKKNRKDKLADMPSTLRGRVMRGIGIGVVCFALAIAMAIVYRNIRIAILPAIFGAAFLLLAGKHYLDGATRQYVQLRGTVVRSDYNKSVIAMARNAAKKTMKADIYYRSFIFQRGEEYIKVQCRKAKELPQVGDKVRVIVHVNAGVYEEEGMTQLMSYICVDRIA